MLALTRRVGEVVVIGDPQNPIGTIMIAGVDGDRVKLALEFKKDIQVNRREVADQIRRRRPRPTQRGVS